jgi:hypothetical protein
METAGVAAILLEKLAVIVTVLVGDKVVDIILSASVSVRVTVGEVVSTVKVMLCVPATYAFVLLSVPDTVA